MDPETGKLTVRPYTVEFSNPATPNMNLLEEDSITLRQSDGVEATNDNGLSALLEAADSSDDEIRCIPKVMQVSKHLSS